MANTRQHAHQQSKPRRPGNMGGQGMGQGRGMNPGEAHAVASPDGQREEPTMQSPPNPPRQYDGNDQKGGDRSDRAARSGATGERSTSGGRNKPEPKNQDEKGMGHPRNK